MKTDKARNRQLMILFAGLSVLIVLFIFGNSLQSMEGSNRQSHALADVIQSKLDPDKKVERDLFNFNLRKVAHLVEFCSLGICVAGFTVNLGQLLDKRLVSLPILIVMSISVGDEYIQHFTARGSMVADVVLDFCGSLVGLAVVVLFCGIRKKLRK